MIAALLLLACQEPFGSDRHTLEGDRIAAVRVLAEPTGGAVEALLVVDGRLWSDEAVTQRWHWLPDDADAATWEGDAPLVGARPAWTGSPPEDELLLVATFPSGAERRAIVGVGGGSAAVSLTAADLDRPAATTATADLAARARFDGIPSRRVAPGGTLRLHDAAPRSDGDLPTRWMGTAGTWLELDEARADWLATDLTLDDGEVVVDRPLDRGPVTLVGLHPEPDRGGGWHAVDVWVGSPDPGALVGDRWLPGAVPGWQVATLTADDLAPLGLAAEDVVATTADATEPPPACLGGAFHPDALLTGRCLRAELIGARVVFEAVDLP